MRRLGVTASKLGSSLREGADFRFGVLRGIFSVKG